MSARRVLVVSGSAGRGHVVAGEAVAAALRSRHPHPDVTHIDALERMLGIYKHTYRWGYVRLVDKHPLLWRALYESTDVRTSKLGHVLTVLGGRGFVRTCRRWKPHAIVCTHFLAPELLARAIRRGRLDTELQVVITDHDAHRVWYWPEVRRYYVASDVVKARLTLGYGVRADRVVVTGIPVRAEFGRARDPQPVRLAYGLDPDRPTVLFLSSGFAAGPVRDMVRGLWMERRDIQVLAVCGRNERLRRRVAALPRPEGAVLHALGFVEDIRGLLAVADLVVGKSGGVTVSECMAAGLPLIISGSIPGQEERNADAVVGAGAGVRALTVPEVRWRVTELLTDPDRLRGLSERARAFGRPDAADRIAAEVAASLGEEPRLRGPHFHGAR